MEPKFALTDGEKLSPVWLKLVAHLNATLADNRILNDDDTLDERDTAALRGENRLLSRLIALGDDTRK